MLTVAILFGIFIYDKIRTDRIKKMLIALKTLHNGPITTKKAISRSALIAEYPCSTSVFDIILTHLKNEDYVTVEDDKIKFTYWGKKYYETKVENTRG